MDGDPQRRESRIRSRGRFHLLVEGADPIPATVADTSVSGLSLKAATAVGPGQRVRIEGYGISADGLVRHCRREGDAYLIGIALQSREPA